MGRNRQDGPVSKDAERMRKLREKRSAAARELRYEQNRQRLAEEERRREILGTHVLGKQRKKFEQAAQQAAALLAAARHAVQNDQCKQAWYQQCQRARELERQVELAKTVIDSLQEAAAQGGQAHVLLLKALADKARVSRLLADLQSQMRPQPPRARAVQQCVMAQAACASLDADMQTTRTPATSEPTTVQTSAPQLEPAGAALPQHWRLSIRVWAIQKKDQQPKNMGGHGYPPVRLWINVRRAKRNRPTATFEPGLVLSPTPLGPTSFDEPAALSKPPQPLVEPASFTMQSSVAPRQTDQSVVQMLHTKGVRLGYVPVQHSHQVPSNSICSRDPKEHPFVIHRRRREIDLATPAQSEVDEPNEVLVYASSDTH